MLKLSIITINYNDKAGLERTIKSVQNQTATNYEHIIIDGASTDGSKNVILEHQSGFSYWVSEPDTGIYNAMNKGIKMAKGEYLLFLNSGDDLVDKHALKKVSKYIVEADFICFNINVIDFNIKTIKKCPQELTFSYLYEDVPPHQSTFIKRKIFNRIGYYDEHLKIVSDWKFFIIAVCKKDATYKYIDTVFSNFYNDGISSLKENRIQLREERSQVLTQEFSVFIHDIKQLKASQEKLKHLRCSKKLNLLIKLGLIHKF